MKQHTLEVVDWIDEVFMLASKGHHEISKFKDECFSGYLDISNSLKHCECHCEHLWYKAIPREWFESYYTPVNQSCRGSFPVTVWWGA